MPTPVSVGRFARASDFGDEAVKRQGLATVTIVAIVGALNLLLLGRHQPIGLAGLLSTSALLWVCAFPAWSFYRSRRPMIPYMMLVGIAYAVYFVLPVASERPFFSSSRLRDVGFGSVEYAGEIASVGITAMMFGAFATKGIIGRLPRLEREIDLDRALPFLAIAGVLSLVLRVFGFSARLGSLGQFAIIGQRVGELSMSLLFLACLRGRARWPYKVLLTVMASAVAAVGLTTGSLAQAVFPIVGLVLVYAWERRNLPWAFVLFGALAIAPFQVTKTQFRASHWGANDDMSPAKIATLLADFVSITLNQVTSGEVSLEEIEVGNESRADALALLSVVVHDTPQIVPYWNGYTYSELLWHFVPRVLVPGKPALSFGQEFGHRYDLIAYDNTDTTVNLGQLIECYANFGPTGVVVGMFLIGFLCGAIEHALSATVLGAAIGVTIFAQLLGVESNFTLIFGGVPYVYVALYLFGRVLPSSPSSERGVTTPLASPP
ncbi:MAG: hypothetical protein FWD17_04570 [Polyangiaceae bacterium]|nr:hypothetical protein [Polyangiaceae bacterium]